MKFIVQGLIAMVIMFMLAAWVAATPTTEAAKQDGPSSAQVDLIFSFQAAQ